MPWNNAEITLLIEEYKKYPQLYAVQHNLYHKKDARAYAVRKIHEKLTEIKPNINENDMIKKWNGLRSTYSAERRRCFEVIHSGMDEDELIKPTLWYFDMMQFLNDHLVLRPSKSNYVLPSVAAPKPLAVSSERIVFEEIDTIGEVVEVHSQDHDYVEVEPRGSKSEACLTPKIVVQQTPPSSLTKRKRLEKPQDKETTTTLQCLENLTNVAKGLLSPTGTSTSRLEDEDDLYAKNLASKLKSINNIKTKLILKNKIDNLIFEAQFETIT